MQTERFIQKKRIALDGRVWWCVWDRLTGNWSSFVCHFSKFKTKRAVQSMIDYANLKFFPKGFILTVTR